MPRAPHAPSHTATTPARCTVLCAPCRALRSAVRRVTHRVVHVMTDGDTAFLLRYDDATEADHEAATAMQAHFRGWRARRGVQERFPALQRTSTSSDLNICVGAGMRRAAGGRRLFTRPGPAQPFPSGPTSQSYSGEVSRRTF